MTIGKSLLWAALGSVLWSGAAAAQTLITPEAFLSAVIGKTVRFHEIRSGDLVGTEQFLTRRVSVWRQEGEGCVYGQITTPDGQICFLYDNDLDGIPVCWWPFLYQDTLMVRLVSLEDGEIQEVRGMSESGLDCPSAPIS